VTVDVARLPRRTLKAGTMLHRVHRADRDPWFFDRSPHGRFNPTGTPDRGACYWAEKPIGAWIESFRSLLTLTEEDLAGRALATLTLTGDLVVSDLTVKRALAAGVTASITAGADYAPPQALADALQAVTDGIRWRLRHDLSQRLHGVALFGQPGRDAAARSRGRARTSTGPIPQSVREEATRLFGYRVLPTPV
jgi:hypothetical protein